MTIAQQADLLGDRGAVLSPCGQYRYRLWRRWDDGPTVLFVMLNPSTADATEDDPTIRRCIGFARREGAGCLAVVNLFAWRATRPTELAVAHHAGHDVVGPENDEHIRQAARSASIVIGAWGAFPASFLGGSGRGGDVVAILRETRPGLPLRALGRTASGAPRHPLYVRGEQPLTDLA